MANITVSTPVHKFMQSSRKRDMQDLLTVPLPFAAFTHTLTQSEWRKAAKFTSTTATGIVAIVRTTTGYARILNHDGTLEAVDGSGTPASNITVHSKTPPADKSPKFYAIYPCDASGNLSGDLTLLYLDSDQITSFDGTGLSALTSIRLVGNQLTSFDGTGLSALTTLSLENNQITSFDETGLSALTTLSLENNQLISFDGTGLSSLVQLRLQNNQITSFDGTGLSSLEGLIINDNPLTSFHGTGLSALAELTINGSQLTSFDGTGMSLLQVINRLGDDEFASSNIDTFVYGDMDLIDYFGYFLALPLMNQNLGVAALQSLYDELAAITVTGTRRVDVTGNPGAGAGSGTDKTAAEAAGWTIIGDPL